MRFSIYISFVLLVLSCHAPVVFDKAYPYDKEDLIVIPSYYRGSFICESDSSIIMINDRNITRHRNHTFVSKKEIIMEREDCKMEDDMIYIKGREICIPIIEVNDSIVQGMFTEIDTLFAMQEGSLARMHKGHLVINQEFSRGQWSVSLLTYQLGGDISFRAITDKSLIQNIAKITPTKDITTKRDRDRKYLVKPTMKEFDELLKDDKVFLECDYFTKIIIEEPL